MDNVKLGISKSNLAIIKELHLKRTAHLPFGSDIAPLDFFLFGWLRNKLASRFIAEIDQLSKVMEAIPSTFTIETTASVFSNWIERLKQIIDIDGDYI
jgi:hypothetical protein